MNGNRSKLLDQAEELCVDNIASIHCAMREIDDQRLFETICQGRA